MKTPAVICVLTTSTNILSYHLFTSPIIELGYLYTGNNQLVGITNALTFVLIASDKIMSNHSRHIVMNRMPEKKMKIFTLFHLEYWIARRKPNMKEKHTIKNSYSIWSLIFTFDGGFELRQILNIRSCSQIRHRKYIALMINTPKPTKNAAFIQPISLPYLKYLWRL